MAAITICSLYQEGTCFQMLAIPEQRTRAFSEGIFKWVNTSHEVAKVLEFQLQHQSFQWTPWTYLLEDGLVGSPCSPRDSQESSLTPQFKSINSSFSAFWIVQLSHSYMTTGKTIALTMWTFVDKVSKRCPCFLIHSLVYYNFPSREQVSFNFMAAVTICSDFRAPQNSLSLFPFFPQVFAMKW